MASVPDSAMGSRPSTQESSAHRPTTTSSAASTGRDKQASEAAPSRGSTAPRSSVSSGRRATSRRVTVSGGARDNPRDARRRQPLTDADLERAFQWLSRDGRRVTRDDIRQRIEGLLTLQMKDYKTLLGGKEELTLDEMRSILPIKDTERTTSAMHTVFEVSAPLACITHALADVRPGEDRRGA